MNPRETGSKYFFVAALMVAPGLALAAGGWDRQEIPLQAGWNLVWIVVDPVPADPVQVMADSGVDWNEIHTFVPGRALGDRGAWASAYRDHAPVVNTLVRFQGNRGYLIEANAAGMLTLTGRPVKREFSFSDRFKSLFGFGFDASLSPGADPTFNEYFSHPAVSGEISTVHGLDALGNYVSVSLGGVMSRHRGYWVKASHDVNYKGPIRADVGLDGVQFGVNGYNRVLTLSVPATAQPRMVTVKARSSETPPGGESADAAGGSAAWVEYRDPEDTMMPWKPLSAGKTLTIPPNETKATLEIRCVRKGRPPATEDGNGRGLQGLYQALIDIRDDQNNAMTTAIGMEILDVHGVWIGQARLTNVSHQNGVVNPPCSGADCTAAQSLSVPLILALPGTEGGPMQLLDKASIMVDRDGRTLNYRYSSILFHEPVTLTGNPGDGTTGMLTGTLAISADHPLNPYRHRYHPEHRTGYAVTRSITLTFSAEEQDPIAEALGLDQSVGDNELVGIYQEVISGLSVAPITVSGPFKLHRLSDTTDLQ